MKAHEWIIIAAAAASVWWVLNKYGTKQTAAAAPKYWVTGGASPDMFTSYPDPGQAGGVWV